MTVAYIAHGSNEGDRFQLIKDAVRQLENSGVIRLLKASSIYENRA